jgi:hypothetical protein
MVSVFIDSLGIGVRAARVGQVMVNQLIFVRSVANFTGANQDDADAFVNSLASVTDSTGNQLMDSQTLQTIPSNSVQRFHAVEIPMQAHYLQAGPTGGRAWTERS